jgi:predicted RNA-binding Zn ribbon-like protein
MIFTAETTEVLEVAVMAVNDSRTPDRRAAVHSLMDYHRRNYSAGTSFDARAEFGAVQEILPRLRELLRAEFETAIDLVNAMLSESRGRPRLVQHDASAWHIHVSEDDASLANHILVQTAMAMTEVIAVDQLARLGTCSARDCEGVVLDLSRNGSRRYCSTSCGNREDAAAYRGRLKTGRAEKVPLL